MSRVSARLIAITACLLFAGCLGRCGKDAPPEEPPAVTDATPAEPATPADPVLVALAALADRAPDLPEAGDGQPVPEREVFRRDCLVLGNDAIDAGRMDVVLQLADVLSEAGEQKAATAFLQRAVGLMKPDNGEKAHLRQLADVKRVSGKALEAASLMERAVDIEPSAAEDFFLLSRMYVAAGRLGPARAAVTRGLRKHADDPVLLVQGAEVKLVGGDVPAALAALPATVDARAQAQLLRLRAELLLITGDATGAEAAAKALTALDAESPWGPLLEVAVARRSGSGSADAQLAKAAGLAGTGRKWFDARQALPWAEALAPDQDITPWPRSVDQVPVTIPTPVTLPPAPAPLEQPKDPILQ